MRKDSEKAERLSDLLESCAGDLAIAIESAPDWQPSWPDAAADRVKGLFEELYQPDPPRQGMPRYRRSG